MSRGSARKTHSVVAVCKSRFLPQWLRRSATRGRAAHERLRSEAPRTFPDSVGDSPRRETWRSSSTAWSSSPTRQLDGGCSVQQQQQQQCLPFIYRFSKQPQLCALSSVSLSVGGVGRAGVTFVCETLIFTEVCNSMMSNTKGRHHGTTLIFDLFQREETTRTS